MTVRLKTALALCAALGATAMLGGAAQAQGRGYMPPGTWSQTCWNADIRRDTLTATCRDSRGRARDTMLQLRGCNEVANRNGNLICASYRGEGRNYRDRDGRGRWLGGDWGDSCTDISVDRGTLYASCRTNRGSWRETSLNLRGCHEAENVNGRLVCTDD